MTYPNAHRGIEKIHIAEIMLIIGTFLLSMVQALFSTKDFDKLIEDTGPVLGIIIVIIVVIGMILTIAADIYNIWGLKIASLDDRMFYIPFFLSILIIIVDTVIGIILFVTDKSDINLVIERAEEIVELVQMVVVIVVSSKLAKTLNSCDISYGSIKTSPQELINETILLFFATSMANTYFIVHLLLCSAIKVSFP